MKDKNFHSDWFTQDDHLECITFSEDLNPIYKLQIFESDSKDYKRVKIRKYNNDELVYEDLINTYDLVDRLADELAKNEIKDAVSDLILVELDE